MNYSSKTHPENIKYLLNRLIKGKGKLSEVADKYVEISPAIQSSIKPSFYFESELDNITQFHPETTQKNEMVRIKGGNIVHEATLCWQIKDAYISQDAIYKRNFKKSFPASVLDKNTSNINNTHVNEISLASSYQGLKYFGHWLRDDVVTYQAANEFGTPISFKTDKWPDKKIYSDVFEQNWNSQYSGNVKLLNIFQDFAQNEYRIQRYQTLRTLIKAKIKAVNAGTYVYLKRGLTGKNIRNLVNEDILIDTLERQGFLILDITKDSIEHIIKNLINAKLVITIEGSHQNHVLYTLADLGGLIIIQPPNLFNNSAKDWCDALNFKHGITICKSNSHGFEVNISSIMKLIDIMKI